MGLLAGRLLEVVVPQPDKRLIAIIETDGCAADGVAAATGCQVGRRTLRVEDFGKVAATFVDTRSRQCVRIVPWPEARTNARRYAPEAANRWEAQLLGYQRMPDDVLLSWQWVSLNVPVEALIGQAGARAVCEVCREEIINNRQVVLAGRVLCRACAGQAYCTPAQLPALKMPQTFSPQYGQAFQSA
jgi:formylmethanofuran dehydrogenase subunit E